MRDTFHEGRAFVTNRYEKCGLAWAGKKIDEWRNPVLESPAGITCWFRPVADITDTD
jgi:hypothetical protein